MSVSVQQLLGDAKRLVGRLREHDTTADQLLAQAQALGRNVEAMRQYNEELAELNSASQRPRSALILSIQQENRHIRELQQENKELVAALEEHQSALELIMAKYREHIIRLGQSQATEAKIAASMPQCHHLADKVSEMAAVMRKAAQVDEDCGAEQAQQLAQLKVENEVLRELLDIGRKSGSAGLEDREVQTEDNGGM
uniref:Uncharacterized protein n=1 Tax=Ornithodoros turicata TaxID=34597 RepID=A0A2R5L7M6_9ACAR